MCVVVTHLSVCAGCMFIVRPMALLFFFVYRMQSEYYPSFAQYSSDFAKKWFFIESVLYSVLGRHWFWFLLHKNSVVSNTNAILVQANQHPDSLWLGVSICKVQLSKSTCITWKWSIFSKLQFSDLVAQVNLRFLISLSILFDGYMVPILIFVRWKLYQQGRSASIDD